MIADVQLFTFTVRATGPGAPVEVRLRRALMFLLRSHGLQVVDMTAGSITRPANVQQRSDARTADGPPIGVSCRRIVLAGSGSAAKRPARPARRLNRTSKGN